MPTIAFLRHSKTQPDPTAPSAEWRLSHTGRQLCLSLAEEVRPLGITRIVTSVEPKANETGQIVARELGISSEIAFGLHEHDRSNVPFLASQERFEAAVREMFEKPAECVFGRESADHAHERFKAAVDALLAQYPDETLGIVSHGTVLALLIARANGLDEIEFWGGLKMPDVILVNSHDFSLRTNE